MKRLFTLILALAFLCLASGLAAAQSSDVTGDWDVTINSPQGSRTSKVTFKQEGEKVNGVLKNQRGEVPFQGTIKGKELKFAYTVKFQDNDLNITMVGSVDGDSIKGTADFGGFAQGDWTAKRVAAGAAASAGSAQASGASSGGANDWELTVNSPNGATTSTLSYKQDGENISGVLKGQRGELPIKGTLKGKEIKIGFTIKFQDQELPITLTGNVDGDTMKGKADFGGFAEGDWTAKKGAGKPAAASQPSASAASSGGKVDVSGTWTAEVETPAGSGSPTFTFKQEGEKLTGQYKGALGEAPINGTVNGNEIKFSIKVSGQVEGTITYTGTVEKNSMKGTVQFAELGSGTWTAKRQ